MISSFWLFLSILVWNLWFDGVRCVGKKLRLKYRLCRYRYGTGGAGAAGAGWGSKSMVWWRQRKKDWHFHPLYPLLPSCAPAPDPYLAPTSAPSFLQFLLYSDLRFPIIVGSLGPSSASGNRGRGPDLHLRLNGKSRRRILAFSLTTSSVAVNWSFCPGICRSVSVGRLLWACFCRLVTVGWSLWIGRCRCCK